MNYCTLTIDAIINIPYSWLYEHTSIQTRSYYVKEVVQVKCLGRTLQIFSHHYSSRFCCSPIYSNYLQSQYHSYLCRLQQDMSIIVISRYCILLPWQHACLPCLVDFVVLEPGYPSWHSPAQDYSHPQTSEN